MKIVKGHYGECRFCDNMDSIYGMPSLKEKSWDLCLTDPPYGGNYEKQDKINYKDEFQDLKWFYLCLAISSQMVFSSGKISMFNYPIPNLVICWYKPASTGHNLGGGISNWEPFLYYGKTRIPIDIIKSKSESYSSKWNHSTPKPLFVFQKLMYLIKPISVLDPFLGSGTTAEVCEELGIPWLGYEIMEEYAPDIEKRIQCGIKKHGQSSLTRFLTKKGAD